VFDEINNNADSDKKKGFYIIDEKINIVK